MVALVTGPGRTHNLPLEGLRGMAALMVIYCHSFAPIAHVDPLYSPSEVFWWFETGHGAVALFFVISGFVIGMTNAPGWSNAAARAYLWRRFIRLVPLYLVAIALSVVIRPIDAPGVVLGNILFQQSPTPNGSWLPPTISANSNLWSLNYEVLYYGLFLAIWRWRWRVDLLVGFAVLLTGAGLYFPDLCPRLLTAYAGGWVFWLSGLWLAWRVPANADLDHIREPWPALLILFVATWKLKILFQFLLRTGGLPTTDLTVFSLINLDFLPICVVFVALTTGRIGGGFVIARNACLFIPLGYVVWRIVRGTLPFSFEGLLAPALTMLAAAMWWWRPSLRFFISISASGFLCYGLYIFQRPAQWLVLDHLPLPTGTALSFTLRIIVLLGVTYLFAVLGERRLQPWVRRHIDRWRATNFLSRPNLQQT